MARVRLCVCGSWFVGREGQAAHPEGPQRPNLKSEDSGLRHRFSEAKVSLWMCENGTGHEESRGPTRRRLCCTPFQIFLSVSETWKSATVG